MKEIMERKVGEVFTYNGKTYIVEKSKFTDSCENCCFSKGDECTLGWMSYFGKCGMSDGIQKYAVKGHEHDLNENHDSISQFVIGVGGKYKRILIKRIG